LQLGSNQSDTQEDPFFCFFHRTFLKIIFAYRTNATFGFASTHKADPSAKPKEPILPNIPIKKA